MSAIAQIKSITLRAHGTLLQDTLGAAALVVMLIVGLHLPSFF